MTRSHFDGNRGFRQGRGARRAVAAYGLADRYFNALRWVSLIVAAALAAFVANGASAAERTILALGDSLVAGYGLPERENFPAQLEAALARKGVAARVVNGGVSGDTSAGGLRRLGWLMAEKPEMVIIELGANDGLRGLDPARTYENIDAILTRTKKSGAAVLLAGMLAPPNLGREYAEEFNLVFPRLAETHKVPFYPFFLDGVAADPALNQPDGMHPNAKGISVIVERILPQVMKILDETG